MKQRLITWWIILRICIEERLVYRGDFALGTLMRFLPIITQIFLWQAIFQSRSSSIQVESRSVAYTADDMIAYYLLTMVARGFSSMPGLAFGVAGQIRSGEIKKYLIQPIDMIGFLLLSRVAHKLIYYIVATIPFALVFFLLRGYFPGWPEPEIMVAFVLSLILSFLLGFFLEATIGMIGFWFLEVSSLLFVYMLFNFFFSGHMFPIDILPGVLGDIVRFLPLQYLAYFPPAIFLGKVQGSEVWNGLAIQFAWVVILVIACRLVFAAGVKRYSGFGG